MLKSAGGGGGGAKYRSYRAFTNENGGGSVRDRRRDERGSLSFPLSALGLWRQPGKAFPAAAILFLAVKEQMEMEKEKEWWEGGGGGDECRLLIAPIPRPTTGDGGAAAGGSGGGGDLGINGCFLSLRHPKSGNATSYLLSNDNEGPVLQELHWFKQSYTSWFLGDYVSQDGGLYTATPVDPVFILLPIFEEARMKKRDDLGKFRQLDEILFINDYPGYQHLMSIAENSMKAFMGFDCRLNLLEATSKLPEAENFLTNAQYNPAPSSLLQEKGRSEDKTKRSGKQAKKAKVETESRNIREMFSRACRRS
ncbi:unnamed protein product [Dovyalis caffra]|uniref:Rnh202 triple barrel domain-containing protein n=1 Tax=Dovyalis caffra TaxID=77055 RepID=A0AAV1SPA9_9ROSI|nr:unnamed protein product [Dovyalis caffra]